MSAQLKKRTSLYKKSKWAIWDEEKASHFVEAVRGYVDGLNKLLTESQKADLDAETTALRTAILGTNWSQPVKTFHTIESATAGRYESLALPARLARLWLELEIEEVTPSLSDLGQLPPVPLSVQHNQLHVLEADRSVGKYRDMDILIEWRNLNASELAGEKGRAQKKQAGRLASIFQEMKSQPTEYRVLECIGYVDQRAHTPARLGTAFQIPKMPRNNEVKKPFYSLFEYLSSRDFEDFQPSLGARFALAKKLAQGFLQFHQLGWLHKNIHSQNIFFFPGNGTVSVESPFTLGFAFSRPYEARISDQVKIGKELEMYQHPDYGLKTGKEYQLRYDLYSIRLLLFEIAKWRPLKNYFVRYQRRDTETTFAARIIEEEKEEMEFRMGTRYTEAVMACLKGQFTVGIDDPNNADLKLAYFDKVVKNLDSCRA